MKTLPSYLALFFVSSITPSTARPPASIAEALECTFFVSTYTKDGKPYAHGTAFLVEDKGVQWIYTNAHVIEGATKIDFYDSKKQPITNFGKFACYRTGSGDVTLSQSTDKSKKPEVVRYGGDGVRLELKAKRELAFELQDDSIQLNKGLEVTTIGDNGGDKIMEVMDGELAISSRTIALTTCKTDHGCSGGPLIDRKTFKVIGLHTWGLSSAIKPANIIWQDESKIEKKAGASILRSVEWTEVPASEFLKGSEYAKKLVDATRLLNLIYVTTPTESGFKINRDLLIASGLTCGEAIDRYSWDTMFRPVIELNKRLGRTSGSSIGINNMEIVNTYAKAIREIRGNYKQLSEDVLRKTPPYFRLDLSNDGIYAVGDRCYEALANAEKWFTDKASVGGVMPSGRWIDLPPLSNFSGDEK